MRVRFLARASAAYGWGEAYDAPRVHGSGSHESERGGKRGDEGAAGGSRNFPTPSFLPFATSRVSSARQRFAAIRGALLQGERAAIVWVPM